MIGRNNMAEPAVIRTEYEGILEVVLNRPEKLNALNQEVLDTLREAVEDLRFRHHLRVMLIRAKGRYFSAGADLFAFDDSHAWYSGLRYSDEHRSGKECFRTR